MRIVKSIFKIFFSFLILFIIFNFFIAFFWEYRTDKKFAKFNPYTKTVLNLLNLDENQGRQLYIETWIDRKYEYDQFVEWSEGYQKDKKYVNITKDGRKITNNKDCQKNFYFYGGSTTFGYNVTDYQTFAQYFKDILDEEFAEKNFCVFNHGRAGFASPWETILFQKHLEQNRIKNNDFVFFIDGVNERGLTNGINTELLKLYQNAATYDYWDIYKPTSSIFLQSLPFTQLVMRIKQKKRLGSKDLNSVNCPIDTQPVTRGPKLICLPDQEVAKTLETFLRIRNSICNEFDVNCYTMLQPYSTVHGKYFEKYEKSPAPETGMLDDVSKNYETVIVKYENLKKINGIIDISGSLDNETTISYVDRSHYSPAANKAIAKHIFTLIKDELYEK